MPASYQQLLFMYYSQAYNHPTRVISLQSTSNSYLCDSGTLHGLDASTLNLLEVV